MKKILSFFFILIAFVALASEAGKKVAIVSMLRGDVKVVKPDGSTTKIKKGDWLAEGELVQTGAKSFAKLSFIDKSTMNVGPKSEMKIEKFSKDEAGVINVISGKIRSQVTKDYLDMDKDKSKLFIKSRSAVMGVRGTDFVFSTSKKTGNSTAILFEGKIVLNKLKKGDNTRDLEKIVNSGRTILPGQFSVVNTKLAKPTVPAKMNSRQLRTLSKNENFVGGPDSDRKPAKSIKSVVPPGLTGSAVSSGGEGLVKGLDGVAQVNIDQGPKSITAESKGFISGTDAKPADGAIVHLESGTIAPLGSDSTFDKNTGEWVSNTAGSVATNGEYVPPQGYKITPEGNLIKIAETGEQLVVGTNVVPTIDKPLEILPVMQHTGGFIPKGPGPAGTTDEPCPNGICPPPPSAQCVDSKTCLQPPQQPEILPPPPRPIGNTKVKINVQ